MDRNALLLYLQNVRDLEIAKNRLAGDWKRSIANIDREINSTQTTPRHEMIPEFQDQGGGCLWWFCVIMTAMDLVSLFGCITMGSTDGLGFVWFITIAGLFMFGVPTWLYRPNQKAVREWHEQEVEEIRNYNAEQEIVAKEGQRKVEKLQREREKVTNAYSQKYNQVTAVLNGFYSMNLLANQYRNLASVIYIYDYMSSSQASLENTLVHEHMENGIQRLEARLGQVLAQLDNIVYETRCIQSDNRANIQRTIDQNNHMLNQLQRISHHSQEAARYAELASNYSKANAYFALADYLK